MGLAQRDTGNAEKDQAERSRESWEQPGRSHPILGTSGHSRASFLSENIKLRGCTRHLWGLLHHVLKVEKRI